MQIESIRHAIGNAGRAAGNSLAFASRTGFGAEQLVFAVHYADIHTNLARQILLVRHLQARAGVPSVFDRHPGMLQKQTLLRVYEFCFKRRYIEKQRIEFIDPGNEATPLAVMVSGLTAVLTEVSLPVPSVPRNFNDAIPALAEIVPVGLDIDRFGIATTQSDNGDRIRFRCRAGDNAPQTVEPPVRGAPGLDSGRRRRGRRYGLATAIRGRSQKRGQLRGMMRDEVFGQLADRLGFEEQGLGE